MESPGQADSARWWMYFSREIPQQAIESVDPDLAVGPVIHGTPAEPVPIFEATEHLLDLLLAPIPGHHLLGGPFGAIGHEHGAPEAMRQ